jgi:TonB family protein
MHGRRLLAPFAISAFIAAGALVVLTTPRAVSAQTPPEKPVVFNHITQAGAAFDRLVHQTYDAEFKVVDFTDLDGVYIPPQPVVGPKPAPPVDEKGAPIEGKVVVFFIVTTEGRVAQPVIINSSDPRLNPGVLEAVAGWTFEPARVNGRQASTTAGEEFDFQGAR